MEALTLSDPQATVASQQSHQAPNQAKHTDLSKAHIEAASNSMHVPQETTGAFAPQQQAGAFVPQQQAGAFVPQQQAGPAGAEQAGSISPISLVSLSEHTGTHSSPTTAPFQAQSSTSTSQVSLYLASGLVCLGLADNFG